MILSVGPVLSGPALLFSTFAKKTHHRGNQPVRQPVSSTGNNSVKGLLWVIYALCKNAAGVEGCCYGN